MLIFKFFLFTENDVREKCAKQSIVIINCGISVYREVIFEALC